MVEQNAQKHFFNISNCVSIPLQLLLGMFDSLFGLSVGEIPKQKAQFTFSSLIPRSRTNSIFFFQDKEIMFFHFSLFSYSIIHGKCFTSANKNFIIILSFFLPLLTIPLHCLIQHEKENEEKFENLSYFPSVSK